MSIRFPAPRLVDDRAAYASAARLARHYRAALLGQPAEADGFAPLAGTRRLERLGLYAFALRRCREIRARCAGPLADVAAARLAPAAASAEPTAPAAALAA